MKTWEDAWADEQDVGSGAWAEARRAWLAAHPPKHVLDFPCGYCRAPAGEPCHPRPGEWAPGETGHAPRIDKMIHYNSYRELHAQNAGYDAEDAARAG